VTTTPRKGKESTARRRPRSWITAGLTLVVLAAAGFAFGLAVGIVWEEPGLAYAYLSAAADFQCSQVVDRTTGIHALIRKADFG